MNAPAKQSSIEIRAARAEDLGRVAELARQLGYPSTVEEIARRLKGMEGSVDHGEFVAQLPGGELTGWIAVFIYRCVETDMRAEVSGLVVDEKQRSRGIGQRLLERAEEWARGKGCGAIGLRSNVIRGRAHAFYERQGYEHFKTQKSFRKVLQS